MDVTKATYYPFDELELTLGTVDGEFSLTTPWSSLSGRVAHHADLDRLRLTHTLLKSKDSRSPMDIERLQWLLRLFPFHGFSYPMPRKLLADEAFRQSVSFDSTFLTDPRNFYRTICVNENCQEDLSLAISLPTRWQWDLQSVLNVARVNNTESYDALTAFEYCKKFRYFEDVKYTEGIEFFERLKLLTLTDESKAINLITGYLLQVYYVTKNSFISMSSAIDLCPIIATQISDFINSEKGHEHMIMKSLKQLGGIDPQSRTFFSETLALMANLKFASRNSTVGFLFLVDHFERDSRIKKHPITEALRKTQYAGAASGFNQHQNLNSIEQHENIAGDMVKKLSLYDRESLVLSCRILEMQCLFQRALNQRLLAKANE